jgi:hypothetical protein
MITSLSVMCRKAASESSLRMDRRVVFLCGAPGAAMADSENSEPHRQNLLAQLGGTIVLPDSEFEQELRLLHAASVEYARNNWQSGEASIHALARTGIFDSRTRDEFEDKTRALLLSASDEDPRVIALGVVLFVVRPFKEIVKAWKSRIPGADDRTAHATALAYPHSGPKEAEEDIRLLKELLLQENEAAFQAALDSEMLGSPFREAQPDAVPPSSEAGELCAIKDSPEPLPLRRPKRGRPPEYNWAGVKAELQKYALENGPIETFQELLQKCGDFASELHPKLKTPDDKTIRDAIKTHGLDKA